MNKELVNFSKIFALFILYVILQNIPSVLIKYLHINGSVLRSVLMLSSSILVMILFIFFYKKDFKEDLKKYNKNDKEIFFDTLKLWAFGLLIMIVSNSIINTLTNGIANNESINRQVVDKYALYAFPTMVITAPIIEEIIFRLSVRKAINNKYLFPILSAILFGLVHVIGTSGLELLYIIPYGALGFMFAYIYQKHDTIIAPISAHIIHNLVCAILIVLV